MRLADLDPVLKGSTSDGYLHFDCPACAGAHQVGVRISSASFHTRPPRPGGANGEYPDRDGLVKVWQASGDFPDSLTLTPSINIVRPIRDDAGTITGWETDCWHGHVTNGAIT